MLPEPLLGRGAAIVEHQRRRAARDVHRLAHGERQRDGLAGVQIAARSVICHHRRDRRRRGVDLQRAGRVGHRAGEVGRIAGAVGDAGRVRLTAVTARSPYSARRHRIAEGQCAGAGAAAVGRGAAVVERQRRRAARRR